MVLKPASDTPVTGGLLLAKIYEEAGLPAGLLSVLVGSGGDLGDAIAAHEIPRVISFTGSTAVGQALTRRTGVKRLALELGGNGPFVVLEDADLGHAADAAVFGVRFALQVDAGMMHVNDSPVNDDANGRWAIDEFTTEHWVSVQHEPRNGGRG